MARTGIYYAWHLLFMGYRVLEFKAAKPAQNRSSEYILLFGQQSVGMGPNFSDLQFGNFHVNTHPLLC